MRAPWIRWTLVSLLVSMPLAAQDTNRVALVVGLHGPGVLVPISSTAALRLDGALSKTTTNDTDVWNESVGMSALFYLRSWDALRSFVGPRVGYSYSNGGGSTKAWSGQVFLGAEYALAPHFGVFGEAGLSYGRTTFTRIGPFGETIEAAPTTSWSTMNGVGLLFRF